MSLRLLVDEDSQDKILVAKLKDAGHDVLTVNDADLTGQPDHVVLAHAVEGWLRASQRRLTTLRKERSRKRYELR